jgi:hypothetical protein
MNWSEVLANAGIPESPGYVETNLTMQEKRKQRKESDLAEIRAKLDRQSPVSPKKKRKR